MAGGGQAMAAGAKMLADESERLQETLRLLWRFEPSHRSLPLPRRLMGVLRPIIQPLSLHFSIIVK